LTTLNAKVNYCSDSIKNGRAAATFKKNSQKEITLYMRKKILGAIVF